MRLHRMNVRYALISALLLSCLGQTTICAATLEDGAKTEREVVLYSSLNNEQIVTLLDAFKKKYPFINASFYRATSERILQRAINEAKAGRHAADVFTSAGFQLEMIKQAGLTQKFTIPAAADYDAGFKDPEGHWISIHSLLNSIGYNTQLVSANDAPRSYEDLTQPKWKGKIGVNLQDPEWYLGLQRRMGKEKARLLLSRLAAQRPSLRDGHNLVAQLLAAGEFSAATNTYAHILARIRGQGGPVQYVFDQPVITYIHPAALAKAAPHPNAGKLLIAFMTSAEGQKLLRGQGRIPSRRGVDPQVFSLRNIKLQPSDPLQAKEYAAAGEEMRALFARP
jgi:iron(III) transport system substrate-binding protein